MGKSEQPSREIHRARTQWLLVEDFELLAELDEDSADTRCASHIEASSQLHEDGNALLRCIKQSRAQNTHPTSLFLSDSDVFDLARAHDCACRFGKQLDSEASPESSPSLS
ncbi:hypothetical protein K438DRAFT_1992237 [Mycena galopus ATCC 62051]|nr:hypothetical protein K438DRAFT_1992237 [Mycena galopus ATCC 62051]